MRVQLAKLALVFVGILPALAQADVDGTKLCSTVWTNHSNLVASDFAHDLRNKVNDILVEAYERSGYSVKPEQIAFDIVVDALTPTLKLHFSQIHISTSQRHDVFELRPSALNMALLPHFETVTNAIGEITHVSCGLFFNDWTRKRESASFYLWNSTTEKRIDGFVMEIYAPLSQKVSVK